MFQGLGPASLFMNMFPCRSIREITDYWKVPPRETITTYPGLCGSPILHPRYPYITPNGTI